MKTKFWGVAIALLALMLCGTVMLACPQSDENGAPPPGCRRHGGHMGYMAAVLNLTDAQKRRSRPCVQAQRATIGL